MRLFRWLENRRVLSILRRQSLSYGRWCAVSGLACFRHLSVVEKARLRVLSAILLQQKSFVGVQGMQLTDEMRLLIAAQACLPILKLGLNYYAGFTQVSVYPDAFWVERDVRDEAGVIHHERVLLSGESWSRGPVVLSWDDIERDRQGHEPGRNVVIHEFVHKIDMLDQRADGIPPIPTRMSSQRWGVVFREAYHRLQERLQHHHKPCVNAYAATSPAEFFAVVSEYFFCWPEQLYRDCREVYQELREFYLQDPLSIPHHDEKSINMNHN